MCVENVDADDNFSIYFHAINNKEIEHNNNNKCVCVLCCAEMSVSSTDTNDATIRLHNAKLFTNHILSRNERRKHVLSVDVKDDMVLRYHYITSLAAQNE